MDGRDAAVIDIAQDLLLRELHLRGTLDRLVFKGGTSLRKLYAGTITSEFAGTGSALSSKLDVSPPPWLDPVRRSWVRMPVHAAYGEPGLPEPQVIRLEENIAEKISRLNRTTTARDLYDLAWLAVHQRDIGGLDTGLIRRLVVLKVWADAHGVAAASIRWKPSHEPHPFDPDRWLRTRVAAEVDLADIGALAVPVPSLAELNAAIQAHYGFLRGLDPAERQLAAIREQDRHLALRLLTELPGARLAGLGLH